LGEIIAWARFWHKWCLTYHKMTETHHFVSVHSRWARLM
jgi:hypothetical protein